MTSPGRRRASRSSADGNRIALVVEPYDGGVAEHVARLAHGLPAHGYEPVLLTPRGFSTDLPMDGVEHRTLPFRRDYAHPHQDVRVLAGLVRTVGDFALVHAHSAKAGVLARVAA